MPLPSRKIAGTLVAVALRPLIGDAAEGLGKSIKEGPVDALSRLERAMLLSQDKAWRALEIGLRGPTWWNRATQVLSGDQEMARVQKHLQDFVSVIEERASTDPDFPLSDKDFRSQCLEQLVRARKGGVIPGDPIKADAFADEMAVFPAPGPTRGADKPDLAAFRYLSIDLEQRGYQQLAVYVEYSPANDTPLLLAAVQHFFRRAIEADKALLDMVQMQRLERQESMIHSALDTLNEGFHELGDRIDNLFGMLSEKLSEVHDDIRVIDSKLDEFRLEEKKRYDQEQADRELMMSMLQAMAKQIQSLTGQVVAVPAGRNDREQDTAALELRNLADQVIRERTETGGNQSEQITQLKAIAKQFDSTQERVFGHLHTNAIARHPGKAPEASQGAGEVFSVARRSLGAKRSVVKNVSKRIVLKFRSGEIPSAVMVSVCDMRGQLIRTCHLTESAVLQLNLRPGRYRLAVQDDLASEPLEIELAEGTNEDGRWVL